MTDIPRTLDDLRAIRNVEERALAASVYIAAGEEKIRQARLQRDDDIRALVKLHGIAETARRVHLSVSSVKMARGR
jgi:hypothetical protein